MDAIVADIAAQLYRRKIDTGTIHRDLYEETANTLMQAVFSGLGGKSFSYDDPNNSLLYWFRQNVYAFSAAKSINQMREFKALLTGPDGEFLSEAAFTAAVAKAGALFNKTQLATERDSAIAQARMAQTWNSFAEDEYIQISTVGDDKVRPWHASLDGFTALKSSTVWRRLWPPFDWNCRCHAIPGIARDVKEFNTATLLKDARVSKYFQSNSGITKAIFDEDEHPHFRNIKKGGFFETKPFTPKNYSMRSIENIYETDDFPKPKEIMSKEQALEWWKQKAGNWKDPFYEKDLFGTTIKFDKQTRNHVFEQNDQNRHEYVHNAADILKHPDEVWSLKNNKGELKTTYIKFYEGFPYNVQVEGERVVSMYKYDADNGKINFQSTIDDRRGALLYRKN